MKNLIKTDFDKIYEELSSYLVESQSSDRINSYYAITDPVPFYWAKDGYGYEWYNLNDANKTKQAPFYGVSGIYLIVNKITNQAYVGKAAEMARRIYDHKRAPNTTDCPFLHTAIQHWGAQNFKYTLIVELPEDIYDMSDNNTSELNWYIEKEKEWIKTLHTYTDQWNYNLDIGGGNVPHFIKHLDDKIKDIQKELDEHPETPFGKLAKIFKISDRHIVDINRGIGRFKNIKYRPDLTFPIVDTNPDKLNTDKVGWNLNSPETQWKRRLANKPWYYVRAYYDQDNNLHVERCKDIEAKFGHNIRTAVENGLKRRGNIILDIDFDNVSSYIEANKDILFKSKLTGYWLKLRLKPEDKSWYLKD